MRSSQDNLNNWPIADKGNDDEKRIAIGYSRPNNFVSSDVSVFFRNLEDELIFKINTYPIVVGCIAWLTNEKILKALSKKQRVSIVIQKEDFLRPDSGQWSGEKLRKMYADLPAGPSCYYATAEDWGSLLMQLNYNWCWTSEAIRWMGNFNTDKKSAFPRMHNKFLVFCDVETDNSDDSLPKLTIVPQAVWSGSFNFTDNSTRSLENAIYITNPNIVNAYYEEWEHIFALSESIPNEFWNYTWEAPEYFRIGT